MDKDVDVAMRLTDDPCIVTGAQGVGSIDREQMAKMLRQASTWIRRKGKWLCALHTEAIAGDPFGRDRQPQA